VVRRSYFGVFTLLAAMALLCVLAGTGAAAAGDTTRVSVDSSGTQAEKGTSTSASISANGRFVAFLSGATNLVADDTNGLDDIFVRDLQAGTTQRVSVDSSETEANGRSLPRPSISADGRYVAFHSEASNLVEGDTNGFWDVFVRDLKAGTTERMTEQVSVDSSGTRTVTQANNHSSAGDRTSISADGRFVAFISEASNLVPPGSDDPGTDVFVHDRDSDVNGIFDEPGGTDNERVNLVSGRNEAWGSNGYDFHPSISGDGRYVAWVSSASNLVAGDTNTGTAPGYDVFVRDRQTWSTVRVSVDSFERQASLGAACQFFCTPNQKTDVSISADGRYVTWNTFASDLVEGDTNGHDDIFVRDRTAGTTERVSVSGCGTQADGRSGIPRISADGRYVAFHSFASNLVAGDTNGLNDAFVRDLQAGTTERSSVDSSGSQTESGGGSGSPSMSADGRFVAFSSSNTDLVADDTNGFGDVFVHERVATTQRPGDCVAPTTTANATTGGGAYAPGTWTKGPVEVTLGARDEEGGSGLKELTYSATGAQPIASTTVPASELPKQLPTIDAEGTTTVSYFATDAAGNRESSAKSLEVKLDRSAPTSSATATDGAGNSYAPGTLTNKDVIVELSADDASGSGVTEIVYSINGDPNETYVPTDKIAISSDGASTIRYFATDGAGNRESPEKTFEVRLDKSVPTMTGATPTGTGVGRGTDLTASFSEQMDRASITTSTFQLFKCPSTTSTNCITQVTNVTVSPGADGLGATLNPYGTSSTLLASRTRYKAVVTTGARDLAGNVLDQDPSTVGNQQKAWYFTTGRK
jgi:Tol biopolymer transport system component